MKERKNQSMKFSYTFVLLSSCMIMSSAMAMKSGFLNNPQQDQTQRPGRVVPASAPVLSTQENRSSTGTATTASSTTASSTTVSTISTSTAPAVVSSAPNQATATVEDADDEGQVSASAPTTSTSPSLPGIPPAYLNTQAFATSLPSYAQIDAGRETPSASPEAKSIASFTKVQPQSLFDGAYKITEHGPADDRFYSLHKKPSQLFNLDLERKLVGEYSQALQTIVEDFVKTNKDDKKSFFLRPMTSLLTRIKCVEGDLKHLLTCEDRIFDDKSKLKSVAEVAVGVNAFFKKADYYLWMSKMSKSNTVYPWMEKYPKIGLVDDEADEGENNIFNHLDKMTAADRTFHAQLPFVQYLSNIIVSWRQPEAIFASPNIPSVVIAGENKWETPEIVKARLSASTGDTLRAALLTGLRSGTAGTSVGVTNLADLLGMLSRSNSTTTGANNDDSSDSE